MCSVTILIIIGKFHRVSNSTVEISYTVDLAGCFKFNFTVCRISLLIDFTITIVQAMFIDFSVVVGLNESVIDRQQLE